jgi:MFS family permease
MSRLQKLAVASLFAMCALDGFDIFAITFAAPAIEAEMQIGKAALGLIFSAALVGMAFGSLLLAPLADIYGRRNLLVASLLLMIGGTLWTFLSTGLFDLVASRLVTGLGVGTMAAVINPLAAEYCNTARRDVSVTIVNLGFPVGAIVGGLVAAYVLPTWGWRMLFLAASGLGCAMLLLVLLWLPEPIGGIVARRGPGALGQLNAFLRRCGQPVVDSFPQVARAGQKRSMALIMGRGEWPFTLMTTAIFFLFSLSLYYIQSWIPSLIVTAGFSASKAALASTAMSLSGIVGGLVFATLAARIGLKPVVVLAMGLTAVAICLFGIVPTELSLLVAMSMIVGAGTIGGMSNLYAILSRSFPASARASGTGFVIGAGRFGAAVGPALGGLLFASGYDRSGVSIVMALPACAAALLLLLRRPRDFA